MPIEQHPFITNRWFANINNPIINKKWIINDKSFVYMPNSDTKSIFLGTFPIWQISSSWKTNENFEFFYGSKYNDFWKCLSSIFGAEVNTLSNRFSLLDKWNIGITDILKKIERSPFNSNQDKDLIALSYNDIIDLKNKYYNIINIFITSGGKGSIGKLNNKNKNVGTWMKDSLKDYNLKGFNKKGFVKRIKINEITLNLIYLYSPSNSANTAIQSVLNKNNNFGINNLDICKFRRMQWCYFIKKYHLEETNFETIENIWNEINENEQLINFFEN